MYRSIWKYPTAFHSCKALRIWGLAQDLCWGVCSIAGADAVPGSPQSIWTGRRSGWEGDEAPSCRAMEKGSLNNSLSREIYDYSNITCISHKAGCMGAHARWEGCCGCPVLNCVFSLWQWSPTTQVLQAQWWPWGWNSRRLSAAEETTRDEGLLLLPGAETVYSKWRKLSRCIKRHCGFKGRCSNGVLWLSVLRFFFPLWSGRASSGGFEGNRRMVTVFTHLFCQSVEAPDT